MRKGPARGLALTLALSIPLLGGCAAISEHTPPEGAYFDVVGHPTGAVPATLGYYGGVALWTPVGLVLGGLLPYPVDEGVYNGPAEVLGTGIGLIIGAPFHLVSLPFRSGPKEEEKPAPSSAKTEGEAR